MKTSILCLLKHVFSYFSYFCSPPAHPHLLIFGYFPMPYVYFDPLPIIKHFRETFLLHCKIDPVNIYQFTLLKRDSNTGVFL